MPWIYPTEGFPHGAAAAIMGTALYIGHGPSSSALLKTWMIDGYNVEIPRFLSSLGLWGKSVPKLWLHFRKNTSKGGR